MGQPNFDDYDIATDRIVLRRLLEFCRRRGLFHATTEGIGWRDIDLSIGLRIDAERVGERLVVLSRRESSMYELPSANRRRTFGQDFRRQITEEAPLFSSARLREVLDSVSTSPRIPIGTQYHIGTYRFGDLRFLVRFSSSCADIEKSYPIADPVDDGSHYSIEHVAGSNVGYVIGFAYSLTFFHLSLRLGVRARGSRVCLCLSHLGFFFIAGAYMPVNAIITTPSS